MHMARTKSGDLKQQSVNQGIKTDYDKIFHPKRLAIVGVSSEDGGKGFGTGVLMSIKSMGFEGDILPVNPKGGTFAGLEIHKSVEDIPGEIDFAIIAVAARAVPDILESCRKKGAAGAEILSSGFNELGTTEGVALEQRIKDISRTGIRVIGPNCFGIYCPKSGLTFLPNPDLPRETGPVAFLSQSGGMAATLRTRENGWASASAKPSASATALICAKPNCCGTWAMIRKQASSPCTWKGSREETISSMPSGPLPVKNRLWFTKEGFPRPGSGPWSVTRPPWAAGRVIWPSVLKQAWRCPGSGYAGNGRRHAWAFSLLPKRSFHGISVIGRRRCSRCCRL